ncbi:MAG: hypothetical protein WCS43_02505 [Verrucomicrobiota bacterium]
MNRRQLHHTGSLGALGSIAARNISTAHGQTRVVGSNACIRTGERVTFDESTQEVMAGGKVFHL